MVDKGKKTEPERSTLYTSPKAYKHFPFETLEHLSESRTVKGKSYENTGRQNVYRAAAALASEPAGQPAAGRAGKAAAGASDTGPASCRSCGGSFLLGMPEGFQGNNGPTAAEWAVYLALTLYAVHQQGNDQPMNRPHSTLGRAVRQLAERNTSAGQDWTEASVLRRFQRTGHRRRDHRDQPPSEGDGPAAERGQRMARSRWTIRSLRWTCMNCSAPTRGTHRSPPTSRLRWGQDLYRETKNASSEEEEKEN